MQDVTKHKGQGVAQEQEGDVAYLEARWKSGSRPSQHSRQNVHEHMF